MEIDTIDLSSEDSNDGDNRLLLLNRNLEAQDVRLECLQECGHDPYDSSSEIGTSTQTNNRRNKNGKLSQKKKTTAYTQALKKKLAEEKKAMKNANKIYKPGECMKHITVEMHPVLMESWFCADVQREINLCGARLKSSIALCDTKLVLWSRNVPPMLAIDCGVVKMTRTTQPCTQGLYINTVDDIEGLVASHQLSQHVERAKQLAGCHLTLVVFGVRDYFKATGRKTANSRHKLMTNIDLEKAITDLLVTSDCDTIIVNTPNELALTIAQFTKAVAEEPYKKAKRALDEQAVFYMRGDNKKCVTVDKDGNGLSSLWQQMIAVLPLSSLETSRALCAEYKTPLALHEELQSNGSTQIADIGVSRAAAPGAKSRRVGPEFARKLCTLFTCEDGTVLLD